MLPRNVVKHTLTVSSFKFCNASLALSLNLNMFQVKLDDGTARVVYVRLLRHEPGTEDIPVVNMLKVRTTMLLRQGRRNYQFVRRQRKPFACLDALWG